jgi:prohibitin 1
MKTLLLTLCLLSVSACEVVDAGNRGILINLGEIQPNLLNEGFHWIGLTSHVAEISTRVRISNSETLAASRDMQKVHATVSLNWRIPEGKMIEVYKNLGEASTIEDKVIDRAVAEILKAETAKLTAEEILTKRMELKLAIDKAVTDRLAYFGLDVEAVNLSDFGFTAEFDKAVEAKQIAEQRAKQAHYEAQQATQSALAEIEIAKGRAESQRLMKASITQDLIQKQAIEKWNGVLPTIMLSKDGQPPFIQLGKQ